MSYNEGDIHFVPVAVKISECDSVEAVLAQTERLPESGMEDVEVL